MIGEIIAIGDELTSGRIANTTSGYAARHLFAAGHEIYAMQTIGDAPELIGEALKRAIRRVEFVVVTGGLGSTSDDMTNQAVAEALKRPTILYPDILERIRRHLGDEGTGGLEKMAWLPEGAEVLNPRERMAGYMLIHDGVPIFFLPGVPAQMRRLLVEEVLPRLASWKGGLVRSVRQRVYRTFGLPEIEINSLLQGMEGTDQVRIGYYPVECEVHVSLTVTGDNGRDEDPDHLFGRCDQRIRELLGEHLYGLDRQTLAGRVGELLGQRKCILAVAESCTGGMLGERITSVAGSSEWFAGGVVAYSNRLKEILLGIEPDLLRHYGAVSEQAARAMAARLAQRTGADTVLSVTGIAGPGGGSTEKPVGTVYIGLYHQGRVAARLHHFDGDRARIREWSVCTALDTVRRALLGSGA